MRAVVASRKYPRIVLAWQRLEQLMQPRRHRNMADLVILRMPAVLCLHSDDTPLKVHVGPGQMGQLIATKAGVKQRLDNRPHAAVAGFEQLPNLVTAEKAYLLTRRLELLDLAAGIARQIAESDGAIESGLDRIELGIDGRGLRSALRTELLVALYKLRRDAAQALDLGERLERAQDDLIADVGATALVRLGVVQVLGDEVGEILVFGLEAQLLAFELNLDIRESKVRELLGSADPLAHTAAIH